jgi:hypothetical protein
MSQIEQDNAEALHFIMTPIRMLMNTLKAVFMLMVLVILVLVNQVGWIVDLGERSQRARISRNNELESQLGVGPDADGGQWSAFDVDFRTQPNPTDKRMTPANRFWDNAEPFSWQEHEPDNWRAKAFTTTWIGWGSNPDEGIPYCIAAMHPDRVTPFFDATPRLLVHTW